MLKGYWRRYDREWIVVARKRRKRMRSLRRKKKNRPAEEGRPFETPPG
jgi:hypothetical protein